MCEQIRSCLSFTSMLSNKRVTLANYSACLFNFALKTRKKGNSKHVQCAFIAGVIKNILLLHLHM